MISSNKSHCARRLLVSLCLLVALPGLSLDICLAAVPAIGRELETNAEGAAGVLNLFAFVFGLGHLIAGWVSDRYGRRTPLLVGLGGYTFGALVGAISPTIEILYYARTIQGLAASMVVVSGISIARDKFTGKELAQVLARVGAIAALGPVVVPVVGAVVLDFWGWRMLFYLLALYGAGVGGWFFLKGPKQEPGFVKESFLESLSNLAGIMRTRVFIRFCFVHSAAFCGLFAYLVHGSILMLESYGASAQAMSFWLGANALVFALSSYFTSGWIAHFSTERLVLFGTVLLLVGGLLMFSFAGVGACWAFCVPMFVVTAGVGILLPVSSACAVLPFATTAGRAVSLLGAIRFGLGSLTCWLLLGSASAAAIAGLIVACAVVVFLTCVLFSETNSVGVWPASASSAALNE